MRRAVSTLVVVSLIATAGRWGRSDTTVGATREIPDGTLDFTPAIPDLAVESGQYAPRVSLEVLPGRGGLAPDVSIVYSAKRDNGLLGAGWGLSFESSIERKGKHGGVPEMTEDDTFWVDGRELVLTADGTYRTEHDDFVVYTPIPGLVGMVVGWSATKDGLTRYYGKSSAVDMTAANAVEYRDETVSSGVASGFEPVTWRISEARNAFGAFILYTYTIPNAPPHGTSRRHLPDLIQYGEALGEGVQISFGYEDRDDVRMSYANGPRRLEAKRLRRVVVKHNNSETSHYYLFLYNEANHSPQSLLSEVRRVSVPDPQNPPTSASEAGAPAQSLARFGYHDEETAWRDREPLPLVGGPPLAEPTSVQQYFTMSLVADVNADARPDLVIFTDTCEPDPNFGAHFTCASDHRVYLNTVQESLIASPVQRIAGQAVEAIAQRTRVFEYDEDRSAQVTAFFGEWHSSTLETQPIQILDVGRDGYADLIKPNRLAEGGHDGWDPDGVEAHWAEWTLDDSVFADFNGDGLPDLVGQSEYRLNTGTSPFIPAGLGTTLDDPVVDDGASTQYDTVSTSCLDASDTSIYLRWDYGVHTVGPNDPSSLADSITADQWVWRNTMNADFNGDGLMDRLITVPFLRYEDPLDWPGLSQMWVRDDDACGVFDQLFLGDGRGGFEAAGYGIGAPMQREQRFDQVRSVPDGNVMEELTYSYHLNHFSMGDFDADGRNEITQFCDNESTFLALADQGLAGPGYQIELDDQTCPGEFYAHVPEQYFGLSLLDYHYSTTADIDGDGMSDLVQYSHPFGDPDTVVSNDGTPWEGWEPGAYWRPNLRQVAQNRLTSITWPHGASTQVTWAWSAEDQGNAFAINVEHVDSITNSGGRSKFSFEGGVFDDGEFMGFGRVETFQPRGATLVETFHTVRALRNKRSTEELYDEGGRLKNLRVHLHGNDQPNYWPVGAPFGWDGFAPYYNPLLRRCEFELGYLNLAVPLGADIDGYIAKCEAFDDEEGSGLPWVLEQRTLYAVMRGGDPFTLAKSEAEERELVAFRDLLNGRDPTAICIHDPDDEDPQPPPLVCRRFTTTPGDLADAEIFGSDTGPTPSVTFSEAPNRTRWETAIASPDLADWVTQQLGVVTERMYVNEYSYDVAAGHILQHRELRDVSTLEDSLFHDFVYSPWDAALAGANLERETTSHRGGFTYEQVDYTEYEHGVWTRRVQHDLVEGGTRAEERTLTAFGEVETTTNDLGEVTAYTYSDCGLERTLGPDGHATEIVFAWSCRPEAQLVTHDGTTIASTTYTRDGYGRVLVETTDPSPGSGMLPVVTRQYAYDDTSSTGEPATVEIEPEPDGSTTLTKSYVDSWGRPVKSVRCAAGGGGGAGSGLDGTYPCSGESDVVTETVYDPATGDRISAIGPFFAADTLRPTSSYTYDEFGRPAVAIDPSGGTLSYQYGLGRRSVIDPIGRKTEVTFDTLDEDVTVAGAYRGGTRRDAFGRMTATIDAAGNQTDYFYDGYNRKRQELSPAVEVLASGASSPIVQRLATSFTYDTADRLLTKQGPDGRTTSYTYGSDGRLTSTWGPDGDGNGSADELERRTYVDGAYGVRKIVVRDPQLGVEREEHLDGLGRVWKQVAFDGTVTLTDHDARGRPWRVTLPWGEVQTTELHDAGLTVVSTSTQGAVVAVTTTQRDAGGRPLTVTDADGQIITHEYDVMGRLTTSWQGSHEVEHRTYDAAGRAFQVRTAGALTCLTYDNFDNVTHEARGCSSEMFLTGAGDALVNVERTYTALGQLDTETDGTGAMADHDHDALGRLTSVEVFDATSASRGERTFGYDAAGNQTRVIDELGFVHRTEYDSYDRVVAVDPPAADPTVTSYAVLDGNWVATATAPTGEVTEVHSDAMGRTRRTCAPNELCVQNHYADGRLTSRDRRTAAGTVLATQYVQYHPGSTRVRTEWDWIGASEPVCGGTVPDACDVPRVDRTFTAAGRPHTITDPQDNVTTYAYDGPGASRLLSSVTQPGMATQTLAYDPTYPLVVTRTFDPVDGGTDVVETTAWERNYRIESVGRHLGWIHDVVSFEYDAAGRRTRSYATHGTESVDITDTFDARGNPVTRAYSITAGGGGYTGAAGFSWRDNGQLASVTFPSGHQVTYGYDDAGDTGRLRSAWFGGAPVFQAHNPDASGRATLLRFDSDAIRIGRTFDTAGREEMREIWGTTPAKRTELYAYDAIGRLERIDVTFGTHIGSSVFAYNDRDRLTTEAHVLDTFSRTVGYVYDPLSGLRTTKAVTTNGATTATDYAYHDGNRLAAVDAAVIPWDGFGRQVGDAAGRTFQFGLANQLAAIEEAGVLIETNLFDGDGLRVARTTPAGGTEFFLPGPSGQILEHIDGASITDYVTVPGGGTVARIDQAGNVTAVVESITGSPYRIGEVSADHLYVEATAFGEPIATDGALTDDLGFHGMFESEASEIKIAGVRAYDTTTGRFLTADPLGYGSAPEAVDAADFFRYAQDNPVSMSDPTGYAPMPNEFTPCLQNLEGGCRPVEQSYEEQRAAMGEAWLAEQQDMQRVAHDRAVLAGVLPASAAHARLSDGAGAEESESIYTRIRGALGNPSTVGGSSQCLTGLDLELPGLPVPSAIDEELEGALYTMYGDTGMPRPGGRLSPIEEVVVTAKRPLGARILDGIQIALDVLGLIDPAGPVFDLTNAAISLARGDRVGAALSAGAAIPVIGTAIASTKWARKTVQLGMHAAKKSGGASRLWAKVGMGKQLMKRGDDFESLTRTFKNMDEVEQARQYNTKVLGKIDPALEGRNLMVINGAVAERYASLMLTSSGFTRYASQIGRNGLDDVYSAADTFNLGINETKAVKDFVLGNGVGRKLAWNSTLHTWQGTPAYIFGQAELLLKSSDPALRKTGEMILNAQTIRSTITMMKKGTAELLEIELGTIERFDDFFMLDGIDAFLR